jgi:hypothetical protein
MSSVRVSNHKKEMYILQAISVKVPGDQVHSCNFLLEPGPQDL